MVADWNDNKITAESFDLILNQNGLKGCSKPEIRQASNSFYRLLKPGGLLIETVINDLEIEKTIIPEFISAGFEMKEDFLSDREEEKMHALDKSKKHAVYCTLTG